MDCSSREELIEMIDTLTTKQIIGLYEVIHYIISTLRGIFSHVEIKYFGDL
jgi:hypothetical protein